MFAYIPRKETMIRVVLIAVILFNGFAVNLSPVKAGQETVSTDISQPNELTKPEPRSIPMFERPESRVGERIPVNNATTSQPVVTTNNNNSITFIENVGQFNSNALFTVQGSEATIFLAQDAIWFTIIEKEKRVSSREEILKGLPDEKTRSVNLKMIFPGSNSNTRIEPFNRLDLNISYFIGNMPDQQYTNVPVWGGVRYVDLYPGVNLELTSENGAFTWQIVVKDSEKLSSNQNFIQNHGLSIKLAGQKQLKMLSGAANIESELGNFVLPPINITGLVNEQFSKTPKVVGDQIFLVYPKSTSQSFDSDGVGMFTSLVQYQHKQSYLAQAQASSSNLLISDLLGGSDYDIAFGQAAGPDGSFFITGFTDSFDFPTLAGYDSNLSGFRDAFVAKFNPDGSLAYSSFLGGNDFDWGLAIAVNDVGEAFVAGKTTSSDFPRSADALPISSALGFLTKFNSLGNQLLYSTLVGDSSTDIMSMVIDPADKVYMLSGGYSAPGTAFKLTPGNTSYDYTYSLGSGVWWSVSADDNGYAYFAGALDTNFLATAITDTGVLVYAISGGEIDLYSTVGVAVDSNGFSYITGTYKVPNTYNTNVFVSVVDPLGSIVYNTYRDLGGGDEGIAVAVDSLGSVYVIGQTNSTNFPSTAGAVWSNGGQYTGTDIFVVKLTPLVPMENYQTSYATLIGGSEMELTYSFNGIVDNYGNVYVTGETRSPDFVGTGGTLDGDSQAFAVKISTSPSLPDLSTVGGGTGDACFASTYSSATGLILGPINTRTGAYDYTIADLSIPTSAGELSFQREYTSLSVDNPSVLSAGWTHNHDTRLIFPTDPEGQPDTVLFKVHTANKYLFTINGDGTYSPYPGLCAILVNDQGLYILKDAGQKTYTFDSSGKLLTYADAQGNAWSYTYLVDGKLDRVSANGGSKYLDLDYDPQGRVLSVRDQTDRSVTYHYDTNGDLDSVEDVLSQSWTYEYDPTQAHLLTRIAAPGDVAIERTEYYPDGRAWKQYDGEDNLLVELVFNADGTTTIKDSLDDANPVTHTYDGRGTLTIEENADGGQQQKQYDFNFRPNLITDPLGNPTERSWSSNGTNLEYIKDAMLGETFIQYENPNSPNSPTSIIDPEGYETKYFYNDSNFPTLPTRIEYPLSFDGGTTWVGTDYEYYPPSSGAATGKVKFVTDALENQTYYTYNSSGQTETVTTAYGTPDALTTTYTYDSLGRLEDLTDELGIVTHNEYDDAGRLTKTVHNVHPFVTIQNYLDKYNITTKYSYDSRGNQIAVIDTYGTLTRTYFDLANRPITIVQNLVVSGTEDDINTPIANIPTYYANFPDHNIRSDTEYDDAGNVIVARDPAGIITRTYYDEANRPNLVIQNWSGTDLYGNITTAPLYAPASPDQNVRTEYFYDVNGNVIATKDTLGVITRTYYDALNRPATVVQNLVGQDISVETPPGRGSSSNIRTDTYYDANGNVIATVNPKGVITRTYYDALNRPITVVQNLAGQDISITTPPVAGTSNTNIRTDTYYDEAGNLIATVDPRGVVSRTYYDSTNRPVTTVSNLIGQSIYVGTPPVRGDGLSDENVRTDIAYDSYGRRDTTTNPFGRVTKYEYNEVGQLVNVTVNYVNGGLPQNDDNQRNIVTSYEYDALGRQLKTTDTLGRISLNSFDDLGRVITATQNYLEGLPQNHENSGDRFNIVTTYAYDVRGSQIAVTDTANTITRTYYDALGLPVTVVRNLTGDISSPTPPVRGTPPDPETNLRTDTVYLGNGGVDLVIDELGETTDYTYDVLGRLTTVLDPLLHVTGYEYDANGNRTLMTDAENVSTSYEYDALNRLTAVVENYRPGFTPDHETNVRTEYTYDAGGNRLSILDGNNHPTFFTYYAFGQVEAETDALGNDYVYDYDAMGNRVSLLDAKGATTTFSYDELNRLALIDYPGSDPDVSFAYDALGRRLSMTDGLGATSWVYTNIDQPSAITDPFSAQVSYEYNEVGNRDKLTYPDGRVVNYAYNGTYRLESVSTTDIGVTGYAYDAAGQLKSVTRPNGVNTIYNYFDNGWLQDIFHTSGTETLASYQYQYDNVGNRIQADENTQYPQTASLINSKVVVSSDTQEILEAVTPLGMNTAVSFALPEQTSPNTTTSKHIGYKYLPLDLMDHISQLDKETVTSVQIDNTRFETQGEFVVNSTGDEGDGNLEDGICDHGSGMCTLRAAIEQANTNPGRDAIIFNLDGAGPHVIQPALPLPGITDPLVIDATTQPEYTGVPLIVLNGSQAGDEADGLRITAGGSVVRGLVINQFGYSGIHLEGKGGNQIENNYIGTDALGTVAQGNRIGILIEDTQGNKIGGTKAKERNLISGNIVGVYVYGKSANGNQIEGNTIGMNASGNTRLGNDIGVQIREASGNSIGGNGKEPNQIDGNASNIHFYGEDSLDNQIQADILGHSPAAPPKIILEGKPDNETKASTNIVGSLPLTDMEPLSPDHVDHTVAVVLPISFHFTSYNPSPLAAGTTFVVNSTKDDADFKTSDGVCKTRKGYCTLRAAIQQANASAGDDIINFNISGSGPYIIQPASALPLTTEAVTIDGTTQPGYAGTPIIQLDGSSAGLAVSGLDIRGGPSIVRGMAIYNFDGSGIRLEYGSGHHVEGNYIGTDITGTIDLGNHYAGVIISSSNNTVGGTTSNTRNVISGNDSYGVMINGGGISGNLIQGNYIGTNATGTTALGNQYSGVHVSYSPNNTIGGTANGAGNLISGNGLDGIRIYGTSATGNLVQGNYIGTDVNGTVGLPNTYNGVTVYYVGEPEINTLGGTVSTARNVISGNGGSGVYLYASDAITVVQGNYIGTDVTGSLDLGNTEEGITIETSNNIIGGTTTGAGNLISGNDSYGIFLSGYESAANGNVVQGNFIGTTANGGQKLGNSLSGVAIGFGSSNNSIGGSQTGAGNLITGNDECGVLISESGTDGNLVQGNYIGTDATGTLPLGNILDGVHIQNNATGTLVGGTTSGAGNVIAANGWNGGVRITGSATGNVVQGNMIGTDAAGALVLGNSPDGVSISSSNNQIGGTESGAANLIAHNTSNGIYIESGEGNSLLGNLIWANGTLGIDLGPFGITPNDLNDIDSGPNNLQNFPVLTSVTGGTSTTLNGTLNSTASTTFRLEFYVNNTCDSSGNGEGQTYLGFTDLTTNSSGNASFNVTLQTGTTTGQFVTATATDPNGNTSEFSACAAVGSSTPPPGELGLEITPTPTSFMGAGESITYTYTLTNIGSVALNGPYTVSDDTVASVDCSGALSPLPVSQSTTCVGLYTTTAADVGTGSVTNSATATASDGMQAVTSDAATATITFQIPPSEPVTIDYVYDPLKRLKEANYSNGDYYHYTYDAVGNRLSQETSIGGLVSTTTYVYDDANRLTSVNGVTYTWDNNGNLLNDGVNTYTYDSANRLKTFTNATTSASYSYNGLGDRLQETVNGITTTFTMDLNMGLTQALSDGTNTYIYGVGRIAQVNTTTEYFLGDVLGSVRQLTDASGAITYARAYDPYGVVTQTLGSSQTSYAYTGEFYGDYNELVYLRARNYAPSMGRFISKDPSRLEANHYLYTGGNPINLSDPSGLFSELTIEGPLAFALCLDIHTLTGFGEVTDLLDMGYLTAEDAVNICKAAFSQKAWYSYKSGFGLDKSLPTTAHEMMGWFVYEHGNTNALLFNGSHPLTRELSVSTLMQAVRNDYYNQGYGFYKYYPFGATHYIGTFIGDSRNSVSHFSLPVTSFIGSFHAQVVTLPGKKKVGFRIDNDTTLESGTHIRGRFDYLGYSGSVEELIERNPSLKNTPIQLILWGENFGGPEYRLISILKSKTRSETRGVEGGGNMFMTFVWKETFDPCLGRLMYIHNLPELLGVQTWGDYGKYTFDPLISMKGK